MKDELQEALDSLVTDELVDPGEKEKPKKRKYTIRKPHRRGWQERVAKRIAIMQSFRDLECISPMTARPAEEVARLAKVQPVDVTHLCYKDNYLGLDGYVKGIILEGDKRMLYYLTRKGQRCDLDENEMEGRDKKKENKGSGVKVINNSKKGKDSK